MSIDRFARIALSFLALGSGLAPAAALGAACNGTTAECRDGRFTAPFAEPTVLGVPTAEKCVTAADGQLACKPAAGTLALLDDGRIIYFDALEGTESVELSIVTEFGIVSANDQTRVLSFDGSGNPSWSHPTPTDAGANPDGPAIPTRCPGCRSSTGRRRRAVLRRPRAARRRPDPRRRRHQLLPRARREPIPSACPRSRA